MRQLAAAGNGQFVITRVLHHLDAALAQALLLPFLGIGGHVHHGTKAQRRCQYANGHAQVTGRAHRNLVAGKQRTRLRPAE